MATLPCVPSATPAHLSGRRKVAPSLVSYEVCTLTGQNNWTEERSTSKYLRDHRRKPLSRYRDKFHTTYRDGYCKKPPPAIRTQKNFAGMAYPQHDPILDALRYQDEYMKPISMQRASEIDPRNLPAASVCVECPSNCVPATCDCLEDDYFLESYKREKRYDIYPEKLNAAGRSSEYVPSFFPY